MKWEQIRSSEKKNNMYIQDTEKFSFLVRMAARPARRLLLLSPSIISQDVDSNAGLGAD